jgi:hypothetical protein
MTKQQMQHQEQDEDQRGGAATGAGFDDRVKAGQAKALEQQAPNVAAAAGEGTGTGDFGIVQSFDEMELHEGLLRGIYSHGFEKPSAIQQRACL